MRTGEAQRVAVVGTKLDDFQSPQQRYINRFGGLLPTGQTHGAPCDHATHQHLRWEERFPGDHGEVLEITEFSQLEKRGIRLAGTPPACCLRLRSSVAASSPPSVLHWCKCGAGSLAGEPAFMRAYLPSPLHI